MLLIDGVKYEVWTPPSEDEFEQGVKKHTQDIFGEQSMYLDMRQKLRSEVGTGSIPDGFVIVFGDLPHWHIVEVELSWHAVREHIVSQVGRFISAIENPSTKNNIVNAIYDEITKDDFFKLRLRKAIGLVDIHKFLADLISKPPILTIIIEKATLELREALRILRYPQEIKVVEFQTFVREGVGLAVHGHLFKPLYQAPPKEITIIEGTKKATTTPPKVEKRVTIKDLIDADIIKPNQVIYGRRRDRRYEARILDDGRIKLLHNGSEYSSLSAAGKSILGHEIDGWVWWRTTQENGKECNLAELRREYNSKLSP